MYYAIFSGKRKPRRLHAVDASGPQVATVCGLPIGRGTDLHRDGDYASSTPCAACWQQGGAKYARHTA